MKKLLTILCLILLVSCSDNSNNPSDDEVHEWIKEFIVEFNKDTPRNIDENTILVTHRWSNVHKRRIIYVIKTTVLNKDWYSPENIQSTKEQTEKSSRNYYCTQPVMKGLRDMNTSVEYNYSDSKNNFLFSFVIYPSDCN